MLLNKIKNLKSGQKSGKFWLLGGQVLQYGTKSGQYQLT